MDVAFLDDIPECYAVFERELGLGMDPRINTRDRSFQTGPNPWVTCVVEAAVMRRAG